MSELNKLRWRCRRGTRELDWMLVRYLENRFLLAGDREQQAFLQLLELEDSELIRYLLGEQMPSNLELQDVVAMVRKLPVDQH